jgi:hypothetical protein
VAQVPQIWFEALEQVKPLAQLAIAVQAEQTLLLSNVPAPQGVQAPVPSPTKPVAQVPHL